MPTVLRAFLLGAATGGRSSAGPTAMAWTASAAVRAHDPLWLSSRLTRGATALLAAGEVVGDKLPATPSRLEPLRIGFRLVGGGAAGGLLGHRYGTSVVSAALAGVVGATIGSLAGARWRAFAADRSGSDLPGAFAEGAAVVALAVVAVR